jgi:hypothetical protein
MMKKLLLLAFIAAASEAMAQDAQSVGCQVNFETLLYFEEAIMSGRETAELLLLVGRLVQADGYDGELAVGIRGISSDDPWYRVTSH